MYKVIHLPSAKYVWTYFWDEDKYSGPVESDNKLEIERFMLSTDAGSFWERDNYVFVIPWVGECGVSKYDLVSERRFEFSIVEVKDAE